MGLKPSVLFKSRCCMGNVQSQTGDLEKILGCAAVLGKFARPYELYVQVYVLGWKQQ